MAKVPMNKRFGDETELEAKVKKFVLDSYTRFSDRSGLEEIWEKCDKLYNCISTEKFYEGVADLFPPETRKAVKTLVNFIDETLFSNDPNFQIKGVGGENDEKKSRAIYNMIYWQREKTKLRKKMRRMLEQYLVKYGTAIVKVVMRVDEKYAVSDLKERLKMKRLMAGEKVEDIVKELKTLYEGVDFQVKDIHNMYWNYFQDWDSQKIIIERIEVDESHLRKMQKLGIYKNIDKVLEGSASKAPKKFSEQSVAEKYSHIKTITGLSGGFDKDEKKHELLEAWCEFDIDGDGMDEECVVVIADGEHVIRNEINPFDIQEKPYLEIVWDLIEGTSLGMGAVQISEKSQTALNDFTNQIMDNITAILDCMKVVDDLAEIPDYQLKSRPNGIIRSKTGTSGVKFLSPELTANEGLRAVMMMKDDIRTATGATMSLQGLPARYGTTASEYQSQGSASARDIFAKLREIEDCIVKEYYRKAYQYDLQFMSRTEFIKILGAEAAQALLGKVMDGQEPLEVKQILRGDYDFIPLGVSQMENKVIKAQQLMNFANVAVGFPPGIINWPNLAGAIWRYMGTKDDVILPQADAVLIAPKDENILIAQGETPRANMLENHANHILLHQLAELPAEFEQIRMAHIQEHQAMAQAMQAQKPPVPTQEVPRMGPELETEARAGSIPGLPVEAF